MHNHPQRLMQAGSYPAPGNWTARLVHAIKAPHIALHGANQAGAIGKKGDITGEERQFPGVFKGHLDSVNRIR